jgi:hypothetical protein
MKIRVEVERVHGAAGLAGVIWLEFARQAAGFLFQFYFARSLAFRGRCVRLCRLNPILMSLILEGFS